MKSRSWILVACGAVIVVVMLLGSALRDLRFEPARVIARPPDGARIDLLASMRIDENVSIPEILLVWLAGLVPLLLAVLLLPAVLRKRLLRYLIRFALLALGLVLALRYDLIHLPEFESGEAAVGQAGPPSLAGPEQTTPFTEPQFPPWFVFLISFLLVALLAAGLYGVYRWWQRTHVRRVSALEVIASVARKSLGELSEGRQWGDVVIEAYARMTESVRLARGVERELSATPREFADRLGRNGLPASAIDELTLLFEEARYGARIADASATRRATLCLESILRACRAAA